MSYEKQTWMNGEVITADKLNHMEDGIADSGGGAGGVFVVNMTYGDFLELDKTWKEIHDAIVSGYSVIIPASVGSNATTLRVQSATSQDMYKVNCDDQSTFVCDNENDHPVLNE